MRRDRDLFGEPISGTDSIRKDGRPRKIGYAGRLATGPKGQRCGTCKFAQHVLHRGRSSHKCELMSAVWSAGEETDISLRAPACRNWERKPFEKKAL
jgi:hypothetical protein